MKKALKIIGNVLLWIFILFAVVVMVSTIATTFSKKKGGVPSIFGKAMISIQSNSMSPVFKKGDMLLASPVDPKSNDLFKKGDVITFRADLNGDGTEELNSHRVVSIVDINGNSIVDDNGVLIDPDYAKNHSVYYQTKGDYVSHNDSDLVLHANVVAVWHDGEGKIVGFGGFTNFLQSSVGFGVVIVLPCVIFFVYELVILIKTILENKQQKLNASASAIDTEEIKRKAVEEYILSQQNKDNDNKKD